MSRPRPTSSAGPVGLLAFCDESIRSTSSEAFYVFAAAVVRRDRADDLRQQLTALLLPGQTALHWHDERHTRRATIAAAVAALDLDAVAVTGAPVDLHNQERARRLVLRRLLWTLDQRQIGHVVLESRHRERDRHDLKAIGGFRNAGLLTRRLRVDHDQARQEPLLWAADAIAGAIGDTHSRTGDLTSLTSTVETQIIRLN